MPREVIWRPNAGKQTAFLAATAREVLYGGAVGGGKTDALLVAMLRWIEHPKHRAILLRRTRPQLQESIDRAKYLYTEIVPGISWKEGESRFVAPSGAIIQFGYAEHEDDILQFKTFEYNFIAFDELTSFSKKQYMFMFLRNRTKSADLPLMIRAGSNPGDVGHEWVYERFIEGREPFKVYDEAVEFEDKRLVVSRQFIPSFVWDNPSLPNRDEYIAGILQLSPEEISAYLYGNWTQLQGAMFKQEIPVRDDRVLRDSDYFIVRAIDFGIGDPTCVLWLAYYPKQAVFDIVSEVYLRETKLSDLIVAIRANELALGLRNPIYSVGSPEMGNKQATSEQSINTMLAAQGIPVERANTDRIAGWARVQNLLQTGAVGAWPGAHGLSAAPNLLRTLSKLVRDPRKPNDLRSRQDDHAADAFRYAVMAVYDPPPALYAVPADVPDDPNRDNVFDKQVRVLQQQSAGKAPVFDQLGSWEP